MCFDHKFLCRPEDPLVIKAWSELVLLEKKVRQINISLVEQVKDLLA